MRFAAIIIGGLLVLGVGTYGALVFTGVIKIGPQKPVVTPFKVPKGMTMVPVAFRDLKPGTEITHESLSNPKTGQVVMQPINLDKVPKDHHVMVSEGEMRTLVLRNEKRPGSVFTDKDFFPPGTRPGEYALIPKDMVSFTFFATKLQGCRNLQPGDHVEIWSSQKYDPNKQVGPPGSRMRVNHSAPVITALVKLLVHDGVVITPVSVVQAVTGNFPNGKPKTKPSEQIEIAIKPDEQSGVALAVEAGATIYCTAHSGQLQGTVSVAAPVSSTDVAPDVTVEKVVGKTVTTITFPAPDAPPTTAPAPAITAPSVAPQPSVKPTPAITAPSVAPQPGATPTPAVAAPSVAPQPGATPTPTPTPTPAPAPSTKPVEIPAFTANINSAYAQQLGQG